MYSMYKTGPSAAPSAASPMKVKVQAKALASLRSGSAHSESQAAPSPPRLLTLEGPMSCSFTDSWSPPGELALARASLGRCLVSPALAPRGLQVTGIWRIQEAYNVRQARRANDRNQHRVPALKKHRP